LGSGGGKGSVLNEKRKQKILVLQQNGRGEKKIKGIEKYAQDLILLKIFSIENALPTVIDNTAPYLPADFQADLVLDFLKHPDLSHDLSLMCQRKKIPVVASGKKIKLDWPFTPVT
jgi:hypothetical protein